MNWRPITYDSLNPLVDASGGGSNPLVDASAAGSNPLVDAAGVRFERTPNPLTAAAESASNPLVRARPRPEIDRTALDDAGFLLPHARTFQGIYNLFNRTYSHRWDEAVRHGLQNAAAMRNEVYYRGLLQERFLPLGDWEWEVRADPDPLNPKSPYSNDQLTVARMLQAECAATPHQIQFRRHLGWCAWFGRAGNQVLLRRNPLAGLSWNPHVVAGWRPVDGDKLQYAWGDDEDPDGLGHWCVYINPTDRSRYPDGETLVNDRTTMLRLRRSDYRDRFVVAVHEIEDAPYEDIFGAGRAMGVGIRDFLYWGWWLRDEMLSWMISLAEKAGTLGLLMFKYPAGNPTAKQQAEDNAKAVNNRNAIAVPVQPGTNPDAYGVEVVALPTEGLRFLKEVTFDYYDKHFERLVVGQSLSSDTEGSGLGGSGVAAMHTATKYNLLKFDALNQAECLTTDHVRVLKNLNHPNASGVYRWRYKLPDPEAKDKLDAITKAASLPGKKLSYRAEEVRDLVGMTKPDPGDEVVGGDEQQVGQPGAGGMGPLGLPAQRPDGTNPAPGQSRGGGDDLGGMLGLGGGSGGGPDGGGGTGPVGAGPGGAAAPVGALGAQPNESNPLVSAASPDAPQPGRTGRQIRWVLDKNGRVVRRWVGSRSGGAADESSDEPVPPPSADDPVPAELTAAVASAAESGDLDAAEELASLADDPEGLAALIEDLQDDQSPQTGEEEGGAESEVRDLFARISAALRDEPSAPLAYEGPPRPGLVPQSGDASHPVRWVRPEDAAAAGGDAGVRSERTPAADVADTPPEEDDVRGVLSAHPLHAAHPETAAGITARVKRVREAVYGWAVRATPAAWELLNSIVDTPQDWPKFGYEPTFGGGAHATADPLRAQAGIGTHLALSVVSKVLASAVAWAKRRADGQSAAYSSGRVVLTYTWAGEKTRTGKVKAVGSGEHAGKTLYGKRAEAALNAQQNKGTPDDPRQKRQAAKAGARSAVQAALSDPTAITPDQLTGLVDHMRTLTVPDLKALCGQIKARLSGVKQDLADRLLAHVRANQPTPGVRSERAPEPTPAPSPHAAARSALDALGIAHAHLSDEDLAARLKAAVGGETPKPAPEPKPAPIPAASAPENTAPAPGSGTVRLDDPKSLADAVHESARSLPSWAGDTRDPRLPHKVFISDLYDAMRDRLPPGTSESAFKAALASAGTAGTVGLSRVDLIQTLDAAGRGKFARSEHVEGPSTFHAVTVSPEAGSPSPAGGSAWEKLKRKAVADPNPAPKKPTPELKPTKKTMPGKSAAADELAAAIGRGVGGEDDPRGDRGKVDTVKAAGFALRAHEYLSGHHAGEIGVPLSDVYTKVGAPMGLSPEEFRSALLAADDAESLRLGVMNRTPHEQPRPDLLPVVGAKPMGFVRVGRVPPKPAEKSKPTTGPKAAPAEPAPEKPAPAPTKDATSPTAEKPAPAAPAAPDTDAAAAKLGPRITRSVGEYRDESKPLGDRLNRLADLDTTVLDPMHAAGQLPPGRNNEYLRAVSNAHREWSEGPRSPGAKKILADRLDRKERDTAVLVDRLRELAAKGQTIPGRYGAPDVDPGAAADLYETLGKDAIARVRREAGLQPPPAAEASTAAPHADRLKDALSRAAGKAGAVSDAEAAELVKPLREMPGPEAVALARSLGIPVRSRSEAVTRVMMRLRGAAETLGSQEI